jgi:predicted O-linked N-acetylglucosamine transferase (SPINDLY family)
MNIDMLDIGDRADRADGRHDFETAPAPTAVLAFSNEDNLRALTIAAPEARASVMERAVNMMRLMDPVERDSLVPWLRARIAAAGRGDLGQAPLLDILCTLFFALVTQAIDDAKAADDPGAVVAAVCQVLDLEPSEVANEGAFRSAVLHGLSWFWEDFDRPAYRLREPLAAAITRWTALNDPPLNVLSDFGDFFNFSIFRFESSPTRQCELALPVMAAIGQAMRRSSVTRRPRCFQIPSKGDVIHVGYMAMGADPADALTIPLAHMAPILTVKPDRFRLTVFAWGNISEDFLDKLRRMGAICHDVSWRTLPNFTDQVLEIERIIHEDPLSVLISDLNFSLPTAIFARRAAPVQIFLQGGMTAWPVPNLDAVYNSWGCDPEVAGWGNARVLQFATPWDLTSLNPPARPEEVAAERSGMPRGFRLIGTYGRLMKVTTPFLHAVERILLACTDVAFVVGGSGECEAIRAFIAASPVGQRMHLVDRYVPGHSWGRILDVFLDTWPLTGGESVRETMAKGCPVVAMHSDEMPALDRQRDPALMARDWDGFVANAVRLLHQPTELVEAKRRAAEYARRMSDPAPFRAFLKVSIESLLEDCRPRLIEYATAAFLHALEELVDSVEPVGTIHEVLSRGEPLARRS